MKQNTTKTEKFSFSVIKHHGSPNEAETLDGYKVYRQEKLKLRSFMDEYPDGIPCAPYDNHFLYVDPLAYKKKGRWSISCTCGSPGVIVGYEAYKQDASAQGSMIVCMVHTTTGRHSDGSQ